MKYRRNNKPAKKLAKGGRKLLSERTVLFVQRLYARGLTMREAAARAGIALGSVHKILSGKHPNQTRSLAEVKKEESLNLYGRLRKAKRVLFAKLPPLCQISWMRIKGKLLLLDRVLAERVNGVLIPAQWLRTDRAA